MHLFEFWSAAIYFVVQGGKFEKANTIYILPSISFSQQEDGFDFPNGKQYHWIFSVAWLFWTIGITW